MGIWFNRIQLITTTSEIVGLKSGMALSREELTALMPQNVQELWHGPDQALLRLRSEAVEQIVASALHAVGAIASSNIAHPGIRVIHKYLRTPAFPIAKDLLSRLPSFLSKGLAAAKDAGEKEIDSRPFVDYAHEKHGPTGAQIAAEYLADLNLALYRSPWGRIRQIDWQDTVALKELFESESLDTKHGVFFDQRFIDFLARNFESIDEINWRKFEAMTCEYFARHGLYVEIGKGRNDDNVDARVWPTDPTPGAPPAMLVQCKRERRKVGKIVVKALWSDVMEEDATSGLIVTTTALSPGARKTCTARAYPIGEADRETVRKWLEEMRTPYTGVILGE